MSDLVRELELIGDELDYPATPALAGAVGRELPWPAARRRVLRTVVVVAILVLLLAATAVAASRAVREFLGLQGATVERVDELPSTPAARDRDLGDRVSLVRAERALAFDVLVAGEPDEVRLRRGTPGGEVSLLYGDVVVTEFRGDLVPEYLGKIAGQSTRVERLTVEGRRAIWIEGAPHLFFYRAPGGGYAERPLLVAANVLLLERGDVLVRLEGRFSRDEAMRLAQSLR
jgi:hypothetical protein